MSRLDEADEIGCEFVIAYGEATPLFELCEETLDAPALLASDADACSGVAEE